MAKKAEALEKEYRVYALNILDQSMLRGGELDPLIPLTTNYTFIWPKMTYSLDTQRVGHFYFTGKLKQGGQPG